MTERRKQVSIRDVARVAGVSRTTVSHALSGRRHVSPETRARILAVAEELGYRASALAQGLAARWNGVIALHVSASDGPPLAVSDISYFSELINAAALRALDLGYWLAVAPSTLDPAAWERIRPDGAIVVDPRLGDQLVAGLRQQGVPVVTNARDPEHPDAYWVGSDHLLNTRTVLDHLRDRGARKIALLSGPLTASYTRDTHTAYVDWSRAQGAEPTVAIVQDDDLKEPGREQAYALLASDDPPDAIYATLDRLALGALSAARSLEIHVPTDLMLAALADGHGLRHADPPITALHLNPSLVGTHAVETIIALIERRPPDSTSCIIPATLLPRASTTTPAETITH